MVLLRRCCCWKSVWRGSFASGLFTLIYFTIFFTTGMFTITSEADPAGSGGSLTLMALAVLLAGCCVLSSVLLLVGLCVDCPKMLIPWICFVSVTTLLEIAILFYMMSDTIVDLVRASFLAVDLLVCALSVYSILCVISQYQRYKEVRLTSGQAQSGVSTTVKYYPSPADLVNGSSKSSLLQQQPKVVIEVSTTTTTMSSCPQTHFLGSTTPSGTSSSVSRPSAADVTSVSDRSPSPPTMAVGPSSSIKLDAVDVFKKTLSRLPAKESGAEESPEMSPDLSRGEKEPLLVLTSASRKYRESFRLGHPKTEMFSFRKTATAPETSTSSCQPNAASGSAPSEDPSQ